MTVAAEILPLAETLAPADQQELSAAVRQACADRTSVYPIGGGTSLDFGLPAKQPGVGLSLANLRRVVDYPARDMTITVEAGITMTELAQTLAAERQWLPIDAPQADVATLGGVVATAFCGPRRYGCGTMRDYVIGISAVDGRGMPFKGGGRVVKNVAGYDFCKLLTGSLGTLGVITQLTLKIRPLPERSALMVCDVADFAGAEKLLAALVNSGTTPAAIELLTGPAWRDDLALGPIDRGAAARLVVGLEGTESEVAWMLEQLAAEWQAQGVRSSRALADDEAAELWSRLREFPADREPPLVLKASVRPGRTTEFMQAVLKLDPNASLAAHAGNGIVIARFAEFQAADVSRRLIGVLQPAAAALGGHAVVLCSTLGDLTRQAVWGCVDEATAWMGRVKKQFDPQNILNPGRFVFSDG